MNQLLKGYKTPISYYGGKQRMLRHILPLVPEHRVYTEAFCGGAAVYWAKEPAAVEVLNDLNGEVVNFWQVLRSEYDALAELVQQTPHSRAVYEDAKVMYERPHLFDALRRAWAFWVLVGQSYSASPGNGFAYDSNGTTSKKLANRTQAFGPHLAQRLAMTQMECNDALRVIESRDCADAWHYVDPPYFNSDCGHYNGYTETQFEALLALLARVKGRFLLSSYPSDLLKDYAAKHGWFQRSFESEIAVTKLAKGKRKVEVLTANYAL